MPTRTPDAAQWAEIHRLMGEASAAFARNDFAAAARDSERVLALHPEMPDALHLLGLCVMAGGNLPQGEALLRRAFGLKPGDAQLARNLGVALAQSGDAAGALAAFARAVALDPADPVSQFNLAVVSEEAGDVASAERAYRASLKLAPANAAAAAGLAALLEQRNALEEAASRCEAALALDPTDPVANLTRAQLDFRAGEHAKAAERLEALLARPLSSRNRALAAGRLGTAYDRLDQPARAWQRFLTAKSALADTLPPPAADGPYSFTTAARMAAHADVLLDAGRVAAKGGETPVFLVGFPRSGTTLLDQMLSGHPAISVLEEQDTLQDALHEYALSDNGLDALRRLDADGLARLRALYWRRVGGFMPQRPQGTLFVDKLPLNTVFMPLIHRLFPAARFIFALRDPRDVVLSCFMQSFSLNEAMRHFLSLKETADYYAAVMGVGRHCVEHLPEVTHRIRYEDVVEDPETAARRLLGFLRLDWDPEVLDFQETARKRRINTPSYHQVAQPIYGSSRQRWRRYEDQLAPVLPILQPFVEAFGYE